MGARTNGRGGAEDNHRNGIEKKKSATAAAEKKSVPKKKEAGGAPGNGKGNENMAGINGCGAQLQQQPPPNQSNRGGDDNSGNGTGDAQESDALLLSAHARELELRATQESVRIQNHALAEINRHAADLQLKLSASERERDRYRSDVAAMRNRDGWLFIALLFVVFAWAVANIYFS